MAARVILRSAETTWRAARDGRRVTVSRDASNETTFDVDANTDQTVIVTDGDREFTGTMVRDGDHVWVWTGAQLFDFAIDDGRSRRRSSANVASALAAPMPATVLRVNVAPGATVAEGDVLVVLEAMKMELSIRAPQAGTVHAVNCKDGDSVQPGTALVEFEPVAKG